MVKLGRQMSLYTVIHPPAGPVSQTHKFPKRRTNLVPHASICTQKITITITAYAEIWIRNNLLTSAFA